MSPEIPVLLLTGYLGSGKTTLLNRILQNERGLRFAVIVNDIGEVNIDADLIQKGGVVDQQDDSLVALQNGCICCSLQMDLVKQLREIAQQQRFDYIVIEASGICEPAPIAQTICSIPSLVETEKNEVLPRLDCIVSIVDALRLSDEFQGGLNLLSKDLGEGDIENLVVQQIEFCNIILLNKASEVKPDDLARLRHILRTLQPKARILECDYGDVDFSRILNTGLFDFDEVATSARWIKELEQYHEDDHDEDEHEHHHHDHDEDDDVCPECGHHHEHGEHCCCGHHHHHGHSHADEYGISTFVWQARKPMNISLFDEFVARKWPKSVIRAKGICYFYDEQDICYVFEQAGKQVNLRNAGQWYATMPREELLQLLEQNPGLLRDWDPEYGDRMQKLVFIGQNMDEEAIRQLLNDCLVD